MPSCQHTPFFQVLSRIYIAFTRKTKKIFFHYLTFFLSSLGSFWRISVFSRSISICLELLTRGFSSFYSTNNSWLCCFVTFSSLFLPYCIIFMKFSFNLRPVLLARACVCVYTLPPWRLLPTARRLWHTWGVWINDDMLWVLLLELLPSSFISISKYVIFHLRRRNSSLSTNWRENDMI